MIEILLDCVRDKLCPQQTRKVVFQLKLEAITDKMSEQEEQAWLGRIVASRPARSSQLLVKWNNYLSQNLQDITKDIADLVTLLGDQKFGLEDKTIQKPVLSVLKC